MDEQIGLFEHTITSQLATILNKTGELSQYLSKSMFLISIGANDFIQNYFDPLYLSSKQYSHAQFAQLLVDKFSQQLKVMVTLCIVLLLNCVDHFVSKFFLYFNYFNDQIVKGFYGRNLISF